MTWAMHCAKLVIYNCKYALSKKTEKLKQEYLCDN
jgi:hypothetical protein